jgi:hypothetical protein
MTKAVKNIVANYGRRYAMLWVFGGFFLLVWLVVMGAVFLDTLFPDHFPGEVKFEAFNDGLDWGRDMVFVTVIPVAIEQLKHIRNGGQ